MLGWIFFAASAYAAFVFSNWFAIGNAILNFWSLGIMHNFGMSRPVQSRAESLWIMVNVITSVIGLALFGASFF